MKNTYYIFLDLRQSQNKQNVLKHLLAPSLIERICIFEGPGEVDGLIERPYDLIVFDHEESADSVKDFCRIRLETSPQALFIHISENDPVRCDSLHLVGISRELFDEYFIHLIGLCFLTYTIRESLEDIREIILLPSRL